jgi:hypothetical protein
MRRPATLLLASGVVVAGVGLLAGAWAVGAAGGGDTDAVSSAAPSTTPPAANLVPPVTGLLGDEPVGVRILGQRQTDAAAGTAVTVIVTSKAPITGVTITDPGGTAIPPMTGALLIARSRGEIDAPTSTTHGHGHTTGARLVASLGATGVFAAKMSPGADDVAVDLQGTRLASVYGEAGRLEQLDLVRGTRPSTTTGVGRPTQAWFTPDGDEVWVNDADAGVRVVRGRGAPSKAIAGAAGNNVVAFAPDRGLAVIAGAETSEAVLVRTRTHARVATLDLPAPVTSVLFIRRPAAILLTHPDGSASVAPLDRSRRPFRITTGKAGGPNTAAVITPDGRRAAILMPDARRIAVLDIPGKRVLTSVATGAGPQGLELLQGRFAIARNTGDPSATWVDVRTPSRAADLPLGDRPATSMALTERGTRLLLTDPTARQVLDVHSMMGRPMVMGVIPGAFAPDDIVAFPGGLRRSGPREHRRTVVLRNDGVHRVTVSSPLGTFTTVIRGTRSQSASAASVVSYPRRIQSGDPARVTLSVRGAVPGIVEVLMISTGPNGTHQARGRARRHAGGWTASLRPTSPGRYLILPVIDGATADGGGPGAPSTTVTP